MLITRHKKIESKNSIRTMNHLLLYVQRYREVDKWRNIKCLNMIRETKKSRSNSNTGPHSRRNFGSSELRSK